VSRIGDTLEYTSRRVRNLVNFEVQHQADRAWDAARVRFLRGLMRGGKKWPDWLQAPRELEIFMAVKGDFKPGVITADMILVRSMMEGEGVDAPAKHFVKDPLFGWSGHTKGKIEVIDAAGGHVSMLLDEPWFGELAERLSAVMNTKT
jgi:hypothetical protein